MRVAALIWWPREGEGGISGEGGMAGGMEREVERAYGLVRSIAC